MVPQGNPAAADELASSRHRHLQCFGTRTRQLCPRERNQFINKVLIPSGVDKSYSELGFLQAELRQLKGFQDRPVIQPLPLRLEVAYTMRRWHRCKCCYLLRDALQCSHLVWIVRVESNRLEPEVLQNSQGILVAANVHRKSELQVRIHRVVTLVLKMVSTNLRKKSDTTPLLAANVKQNTASRIIHYPHELVKLLSAVTALRPQHVSGEAFRMYADRHSICITHCPLHYSNNFNLRIWGCKSHQLTLGLDVIHPHLALRFQDRLSKGHCLRRSIVAQAFRHG
mmetsp:Transcript_39996/g.95478  ORF Transcript_39996/g.95478 Transcript_39996/m.95478 type:complete len:283 (-) Transcript_39996:21-869(-)